MPKKAVIPAAGLGTRFLPATKTIPKEMLPLVDQPSLLYIVEEAVASGIEDIILITGRHKSAIDDFFDCSYELEDTLSKKGQTALLERLVRIREMAHIISIRQKEAKGLGHAVWCAKPIVGSDPFALLLGDEVMLTKKPTPPVTRQLMNAFKDHALSVVAVMEVERKDVSKYGIVAPEKIAEGPFRVRSVVEKPDPETAPSQFALPGRYVFTPAIFKFLKDAKPGKGGEIQLTDAMTQLAQSEGLIASRFLGQRHDTGDKFGYLKANVEIALEHPELSEQMKNYIMGLAHKLSTK